MRQAVAVAGWEGKVVPRIKTTGCHGFCSRGPLMVIEPGGLFYQRVTAADVPEIVSRTLFAGEVIKRLQYRAADTKEVIARAEDIPYTPSRRASC